MEIAENVTYITMDQATATPDGGQETYAVVELVFKIIGLPIVSGFGIVANILNLVVLSKHSMIKTFGKTTSAHVCILALSVADFGVCLFAFPYGILSRNNQNLFREINFALYYPKIADAAVNLFMMCSTWFVVILASERYVAVCHPLRVKEIVTFPRTLAAITVTCLISFGLCLPKAWWLDIVVENQSNITFYKLDNGAIRNDRTFAEVYILVLRILQNYLPLLLIAVLNIRLIYELRKTYSRRLSMENGDSRRSRNVSEKTHKLNVTLIGVIVIYLALVVPSEISKLIHIYGKYHLSNSANYDFKIARDVTNFMQVVNFAINFIWYCFALAKFRQTLRQIMLKCVECKSDCFDCWWRRYRSVKTSPRTNKRRKHRSATGSQSSTQSQVTCV